MATKPVSTTGNWRELQRTADAMVPADISDHAPVRITDGGRAVRLSNSRVTLPVLICSYRDGDSIERLANEFLPQLDPDDVEAVIDYYRSPRGSWIDTYIDLLTEAADLRHRNHRRRWEAGEFGPNRFGSESQNGSDK